jgi:hypothetical protein
MNQLQQSRKPLTGLYYLAEPWAACENLCLHVLLPHPPVPWAVSKIHCVIVASILSALVGFVGGYVAFVYLSLNMKQD